MKYDNKVLLSGERIMTKLEFNYQKALIKAKEEEMIEVCLKNCICPECGEILNHESKGYAVYISMHTYICNHCNFKAIRYK